LQQYITLTLYHQQMLTAGVQAATKLLGMIHDANLVSPSCMSPPVGGWVGGWEEGGSGGKRVQVRTKLLAMIDDANLVSPRNGAPASVGKWDAWEGAWGCSRGAGSRKAAETNP
jgi:hypothetical protein